MNSKFRKFSRRDFLRIAALTGAVLAIPALRLETGEAGTPPAFQKSAEAMGTTVTISIEGVEDPNLADFAACRALDETRRLATLLSHFPGGTQIYALDQEGSLEAPSDEVVSLLRQATEASDASEGGFDATVEPVLNLLQGFLAGQPFPSDAQFESARRLIDYEKVSVGDRFVSFGMPGMGITLDGIATGYILDRAVASLKGSGISSALVNVGGTIAAVGSRANGLPWEIGITDPENPDSILGTLHLKDQAVATSGDYENFYTADRRYYHIIDPRTARSPLYSHSATVVAPTAVQADQMGVVLMVDDPSAGPKFAESQHCDYFLYTRSSGTRVSAGMEELMK